MLGFGKSKAQLKLDISVLEDVKRMQTREIDGLSAKARALAGRVEDMEQKLRAREDEVQQYNTELLKAQVKVQELQDELKVERDAGQRAALDRLARAASYEDNPAHED